MLNGSTCASSDGRNAVLIMPVYAAGAPRPYASESDGCCVVRWKRYGGLPPSSALLSCWALVNNYNKIQNNNNNNNNDNKKDDDDGDGDDDDKNNDNQINPTPNRATTRHTATSCKQ
jgi:hypothetical protein